MLVRLYAGYVVVLRGETTHEPKLGVPGYLQNLPRPRRTAAVLLMFAYALFVILVLGVVLLLCRCDDLPAVVEQAKAHGLR